MEEKASDKKNGIGGKTDPKPATQSASYSNLV